MAGGGLAESMPHTLTATPNRGRVVCRSEGVVKLAETQAKEKNNKPHEERGNQEQYKKATPSFSAHRLQLTVIFYHFAGEQVIYNNPTALYACLLHSCVMRVSWNIVVIPWVLHKKRSKASRYATNISKQVCRKIFPPL